MDSLIGKKVILFCMNYIYTGILCDVDSATATLEDGYIVYETGAFSDPKFKDAQFVSNYLHIHKSSIESYCVTEKT